MTLLLALLAALLASPGARAAELPPIRHVFILVLENKDYEESFGAASKAPYLAKELPKQGQLLTQYHGTSHLSLGNYLSMISGQAPNPDTQGDCNQSYKDVFPGTPTPDGQVVGAGCIYPKAIKTLPDQLEEKGFTWGGYMQDMGNAAPAKPATCRHPAIGATDDTQSARKGDQYAARHNPFVYFHTIIDDQPRCDANVVPLTDLPADLASEARTPNYVFITPNLCDDAHDAPCVDGKPGGLVSADAFLRTWVPMILDSPAYKQSGLLLVTYDEANFNPGSSTACCDEPTGPNTPTPGIYGPGGGRTGTVVLSPFTRPGSVNNAPYNHYSMLRSVEDLFGLGHLGYAGQGGLKAFGADVFNAEASQLPPPPSARRCATKIRGVRRHKRYVVEARSRLGSRLTVTVKGKRITRPQRMRACVLYRVVLPKGHGRARVSIGRLKKRVRF